MKNMTTTSAIILAIVFFGCSEPLTTREKGAVVGTVGGAGLGAIIGSATGNAGLVPVSVPPSVSSVAR